MCAFLPFPAMLLLALGWVSIIWVVVGTVFIGGLPYILAQRRRHSKACEWLQSVGHKVCPECLYDLQAVPSPGHCPECGLAFSAEQLPVIWRRIDEEYIKR